DALDVVGPEGILGDHNLVDQAVEAGVRVVGEAGDLEHAGRGGVQAGRHGPLADEHAVGVELHGDAVDRRRDVGIRAGGQVGAGGGDRVGRGGLVPLEDQLAGRVDVQAVVLGIGAEGLGHDDVVCPGGGQAVEVDPGLHGALDQGVVVDQDGFGGDAL